MKQLLLLLTFLFCTSSLVQAQEIIVPQTNLPMITKRTASWCTNCGTWGWSLFENLLSDNQENALLITAHHSGNYQNDVAKEITSNFGAAGQPVFYFNSENQGANSSNSSTIRSNIQAAVENFNATMPIVQAGIDAQVDDAYMVNVDVKTEFFQEEEGDFYLGIYLIEKNFTGPQTPIGDNAQHKQILRLSATNTTFGELFVTGQIASGTTHDANFQITSDMMEQADITDLDRLFDDGFEVATIIWEEINGDYEVVNTNRSSIGILSSNEVIQSVSTFSIYPNPSINEAAVNLNLDLPLEEVAIELTDIQGQLIRTIYQGQLAEGIHQFGIAKGTLSSGMYIVAITSERGKISKKLIFN